MLRLRNRGLEDTGGPRQSANFVQLTTRGRKTGLPHTVQLRYARFDGSFYVIPGRKDSDWMLNALRDNKGVLRIGELLFETSAELASDSMKVATTDKFRRKYGRRFTDQWYGRSTVCLRLSPNGPAKRRGSASGEFSTKSTVREWKNSGRDYYADVASAFDSASDGYDFTIRRNFINTWIRRRSIQVLKRYLTSENGALEIGCGTGAEALEISGFVKWLVAVDVSQGMVDILNAKVRANHLEGKIFPVRATAANLSAVRSDLRGEELKVAYSFNGALNCEPRIGDFVEELSGLLCPGGVFICSVRNTLCLSEVLSHAAVLQFERANPRKRQPIMVSVGGREIPSTYYSPKTFINFFRPRFKPKEIIALPGLLPPAYLSDYYLRFRSVSSIIERFDMALSNRFPLNRFGDQTLFVLEKS
jgi:SAM-dependent methyltransferase